MRPLGLSPSLPNQGQPLRDRLEMCLKLDEASGSQVFGKRRWRDGNQAGSGTGAKGI